MFLDFRRGAEHWPSTVELVDGEAATEQLQAAKEEIEKEAEKKNNTTTTTYCTHDQTHSQWAQSLLCAGQHGVREALAV